MKTSCIIKIDYVKSINLGTVLFVLILKSFGIQAQQCAQPVRFTWEGAVNGNKAVWNVNDVQNVYPNIGGVDVTVKLIDPFLKNTNTTNPSDYGDYTKTNTFFGRGNLALQITSTQSNQPVCLEFSFSKHIFLNKFEVFDIDYIGSGSNTLNTYQDSLSFFAVSDSGNVSLKVEPLKIPNQITFNGQQLSANYIHGVNGDLVHTDSTGAVRVVSDDPVNKLTLCYANGFNDADGLSNSQAIKIMPFEFCIALGRVSGRVTEFLTNIPLAGSILTLVDLDGNVVKDKDGFDQIFTTGPDGYYQFLDVPFGLYKVVQVNPPGFDSENDVDGVNDEQIFVNVNVKSPYSDGNDFYEKVQSPLPVRFGGMSLKRNHDSSINVSWITEGEQNSDFFEISLSTDGRLYAPAARVQALGNSSNKQFYHYSFWDTSPRLFVRLEQIDLDGKKHFLDLKYIDSNHPKENKFRIYPNPVAEMLTIELQDDSFINAIYEINDGAGSIISRGRITAGNFQINTDTLIPGFYTVKIHVGTQVYSKNFVVVK